MKAVVRLTGVLLLVLGGCRFAGGAPSETAASAQGRSVSTIISPTSSAAEASGSADPHATGSAGPNASGGAQAPTACGFPDGTPLSFAARSTYAALRVGDAKGAAVDPMSDDPADIYITRDQFAQGQQRGRLVCALFVDQPSFVEITMHPEDWDPVVPEAPTPAPTPLPSGFIEIMTHCGLSYVRIEYDGGLWRFDVEPDGTPPPGWGFNTTVIELLPGASGPVVIGPDGSRWPLIQAEQDPSSGGCL